MKNKVYAKTIKLDWVPEGMYIIYSNGEVYVKDTNRLVSTSINGNGYLYISLRSTLNNSNHPYKSISVHRLLATQFIERTEEDIRMNRSYVHFKDFDRENVAVDNLEWLNAFELNMKIYSRYNDDCDVRECLQSICKCLEKGYSPKDVCDLVGLNRRASALVGKIYKRQIFTDMTRRYKF